MNDRIKERTVTYIVDDNNKHWYLLPLADSVIWGEESVERALETLVVEGHIKQDPLEKALEAVDRVQAERETYFSVPFEHEIKQIIRTLAEELTDG